MVRTQSTCRHSPKDLRGQRMPEEMACKKMCPMEPTAPYLFSDNSSEQETSGRSKSANGHRIPPPQLPKSGISPKLPQEVIQEVIGVQQFVIAEYLSQVLLRSVQEVIRVQHADILREVKRLPQSGHSRCDSQKRAP